ncbi:hypothetical protein OHA77_05740 [Streptosporangium sp. NBC_01639]|uniref:hypothetical protein n=1 Tax=Streptosporangium sp. NBC_01639 TaxID=2975948 RepID=UPI00386E9E28|nr:hypothetical protein OHA77_05740 [Streptosporangium sp. NBC_01639]
MRRQVRAYATSSEGVHGSGVPLEDIARLVGHSGIAVTEAAYRRRIRPALLGGAEAMDRIFT